jgi:phytoene dehydrogenase-like protein
MAIRGFLYPGFLLSMHVDVLIIGAGMSGLAAGIRLAYYDKSVVIVEKHESFGGLNSYYTLDGRAFDVGLHALTNYVGRDRRQAPLNKLLRQLRIDRDSFQLCEQRYSQVAFPGRRLNFSNDVQMLFDEIAREFPSQIDRFCAFVERLRAYDDVRLDAEPQSARHILSQSLTDPLLNEMLLCPIMYYGCPQARDMDFASFVTMFKSLFLEGFARPIGGVRTIIKTLVKKFRACGGKLKMKCGVQRVIAEGPRIEGVFLEGGQEITADVVLSSAGYHETLRLIDDSYSPEVSDVGQLTFVESISVLDTMPADLGLDATITFFNDGQRFAYEPPTDEIVDVRSGVICCPTNYDQHDGDNEGVIRLTSLANYDGWAGMADAEYLAAKDRWFDAIADRVVKFIPEFRDRIIYRDMFTPRTITKYTGHWNGAVYGMPNKIRDGRTDWENLFIIGTDQGFLGIIGAMLSGITIANLHVLAAE